MSDRREAERVLKGMAGLADDEVRLAEAALALAALDIGTVDLAGYRDHVAGLARAVAGRARGGERLADRVAALTSVIVEEHGYAGDTESYDDLENANLIRVIDRRRGLPVALGILYLDVAHRNGWPATGLSFPGHFLIRLDEGDARAIVDPFEGGAVRGAADLRAMIKLTAGMDAELRPEHYRPVERRQVLMRLQNNIKVRQIKAGHLAEAATTVERMLLFAPDEPVLRREAGLIYARLGQIVAAVRHLEAYRARCPAGAERAELDTLLRKLNGKLN